MRIDVLIKIKQHGYKWVTLYVYICILGTYSETQSHPAIGIYIWDVVRCKLALHTLHVYPLEWPNYRISNYDITSCENRCLPWRWQLHLKNTVEKYLSLLDYIHHIYQIQHEGCLWLGVTRQQCLQHPLHWVEQFVTRSVAFTKTLSQHYQYRYLIACTFWWKLYVLEPVVIPVSFLR